MKKLFTIIICSYNGEERIARAIESVLKQEEYSKLVDKFILVDNNSTDTTQRIMKQYQVKIDSISYIYEARQGLSYARLAGVERTSSEWIVFIDDDNILDPNWLFEAYQYIMKNAKVGVFNGAVVPLTEFEITEEEEMNLQIACGGLALTHLKRTDIDVNELKNKHHGVPFGAGLVIKNAPLQKLAKRGWLGNTGRNGGRLTSGEDTEMCLFVQQCGFEFGFNPKMVMEHLIPRGRLDMSYLRKLWGSFAEGDYIAYHQDKISTWRKVILIYKNLRKYLKKKLAYNLTNQAIKRKKLELDLIYLKAILDKLYKNT